MPHFSIRHEVAATDVDGAHALEQRHILAHDNDRQVGIGLFGAVDHGLRSVHGNVFVHQNQVEGIVLQGPFKAVNTLEPFCAGNNADIAQFALNLVGQVLRTGDHGNQFAVTVAHGAVVFLPLSGQSGVLLASPADSRTNFGTK